MTRMRSAYAVSKALRRLEEQRGEDAVLDGIMRKLDVRIRAGRYGMSKVHT